MEMVEEGQNQHKICQKRIKFKEIEEKGEVDRLSALPDCLLVEILSRLPLTEYAVSTCILSKRWKHLWTLIPTLIFTDRDSCFPRPEFYSFVDKALAQRPQSKLKKLEVDATYDSDFESPFNNWIRYAISCNVEQLILKLYSTWRTVYELDRIFYISSCFTYLTLDGCISNPNGAISWKNLRSLSISNGKLDEDLIKNILSGSPVLETLVLCDCGVYRRLDITSKSVKNLVLDGYNEGHPDNWEFAEVIEINAPNISLLSIRGELLLWKLLLINVTSLIEAKLDYLNHQWMYKKVEEGMLKGIIVNLCNVMELKIGVRCSKVLSRLVAKGFDLPSNIKFLDGESESEFESESESESESEFESDPDN